MRSTLAILWVFCLSPYLNGQQIEGRIVDSLDNTPLEYASIGIVGTPLGTITDQQGFFLLEAPEQDSGSAEVTITPMAEPYSLGTSRYTRLGNWCGWGGSRFGKGHEIGTKTDLGDQPVHIRKLHVHVHRQAYDTIWFCLHIRSLKDELPDEELLNSNVIVAIDEEKGWVELDLEHRKRGKPRHVPDGAEIIFPMFGCTSIC
jgi:hypothetical protein